MEMGGVYFGKPGTDAEYLILLHKLAKSFKLSSELINAKFDEITKQGMSPDISGENVFLCITASTNLAFSCELVLKALLLKHKNEKAKGHDLHKLIGKLDSAMQADIEKCVVSSWTDKKNPLGNYQKRLVENSLAFTDLRYAYEGNLHHSFTFIKVLNDVLFSLYEKP